MSVLRYALLSLLFLLITTSLVEAKVVWIDPAGDDNVSCVNASSASLALDPGVGHYKKTPRSVFANNCMASGDTLMQRGGTYTGTDLAVTENLVTVPNGTPSQHTVIRGAGKGITIMRPDGSASCNNGNLLYDGAYVDFTDYTYDISNTRTCALINGFYFSAQTTTSHDILVQDMEILGAEGSGVFSGNTSTNITIRRVHAHNNGFDPPPNAPGHGFYIEGNNHLIEDSEFDHNGCATCNSAGGQFWFTGSSGVGTGNVFRRNYVHDNVAFGLALRTQGALVYDNQFINNGTGSAINIGYDAAASGNQLYNNFIYKNTGASAFAITIGIFGTSNNTLLTNNYVLGYSTSGNLANTNGQVNVYSGTGTVLTTNRFGGVVTDCAISTMNFHLKSGPNPCVDGGTTLASVPTDFDGVVRPQGCCYDIGAFEFAGGDITPPTAPSALTATPVSGTQVNLAWTASTDNVGVTNYLIERCQGAGCSNFSQVGTSASTTFSDTGLTTVVTYLYRVRATDAAANLSGYSNTATATTLDTIAPTSPSGLVATAASSSQINLSWTGSTDNVAVTAYLVERCLGAACGGFVQLTSTTNLSLIDTGLAVSSIYRYRVRATDAANNLSGYSAIAQATTLATDLTPPTIPTNLHFVSHTNSSITMAWTASTDNVAVAGYQIFQCQGSSCTPTVQVGTASTTTFTDSPLPCLASSVSPYTYTVRAIDPSGNLSAQSAPLTATVLSCTLAPLPPSNVSLAAIADYSRTQITWTQAGAGPPDTYRMDCGMTSGNPTFSKVVTGITLAAFIKDVLPGQGQWFCVVVATTSNVDSSVSNEVVTNVVGPGFGAWGFSY